MWEDIVRKLTSRKFWVAIIGFVTGLLIYFGKTAEQAEQIAALIMSGASVIAYIVGEGMADAASAGADIYIEPQTQPPEEDEE